MSSTKCYIHGNTTGDHRSPQTLVIPTTIYRNTTAIEGNFGLGFSCHHSATMALHAIKSFDDFEVIMVPFGPLNPGAAKELFPLAKSKGIGTVAMKPFGGGGGFFNAVRSGAVPNPMPEARPTDGRPYQAALRWVLKEKNLDCTVPGMTSVKEIDELATAAKEPFNEKDEEILDVYTVAFGNSGKKDSLSLNWA